MWDLAGSKGPKVKDGKSPPLNLYIGHFLKPYFKDRVTGVVSRGAGGLGEGWCPHSLLSQAPPSAGNPLRHPRALPHRAGPADSHCTGGPRDSGAGLAALSGPDSVGPAGAGGSPPLLVGPSGRWAAPQQPLWAQVARPLGEAEGRVLSARRALW